MADEAELSTFNISNFIYWQDGALANNVCDSLIAHFDEYASKGGDVFFGKDQFKNSQFGRDDTQIFMPQHANWFMDDINKCIGQGIENYASQIASVGQAPLSSSVAKVQKTPVGGGFSTWHIEQGAGSMANRFAVWMIYLNDVESGGDTEFLYQQQKMQAKKGRLVIWPAGLTHPHRGNPPYSNEKYVVTGWFSVAEGVLEPERFSQDA